MSWPCLRFAPLALAVTLAAPADAGVPIYGRVLGEGRALPEATIRLFEHIPEFQRDLAYAKGRLDAAPVGETTTDGRGRFRLDAPDIGMWTVRVEAIGRLPAELVLRPLLDAVVLPDAELEGEAWLDIAVRGPKEEGIAGAWILAAPDASPPGSLRRRLPAKDRVWRTPRSIVQTDDEGHARVFRPSEKTVFLETNAPGFRSATRQVRPASSPIHRMDLEPGRPRMLRALDPEGRAVPEALVFQQNGLLPLGRTDAEGRVTVFQGETALRLVLQDREARRGDLRLLPPEPGKEPSETPVVLRSSPAVSGRVIDRASRFPIAGAIVWTAISFTRSAEDGTFRLPLPARESRVLLVAAPRYATERLRSAPSHETTLALRPAAAVGGRVVDENGRPQSDVEITAMERFKSRSLLSLRNRPPEHHRVSRTLPGGGFQISGLDARATWHLTFRAEGFAIEERTLDDLAPFEERTDLEIVLRRGCRGFGHVHDEDGEPVAGAVVRLTPVPSASPEEVPGPMTYSFEGLEPEVPELLTDREGRFELRELAPGRLALDATANGFVPGRLPAVEVPEGCANDDFGTLVLRRGAAIVGRAVDVDGQGVAGAEVRVTTDTFVPELYLPLYLEVAPAAGRAETAADGSFTVGALRPGEQHHLLVTKDGLAPGVALGVTAPHDKALEVVLPPAGRISGHVTDEDGRSIVGAALRLNPDVRSFAMSGVAEHWTDDHGAFEISGVAPGRWTLWASAPGFQEYRRDGMEVEPASEIRDLEVVLAEGAELSGRVFAPDGSPAVDALVRLRTGPRVFTDGDGRYRFSALTPGIAQIEAEHDDYPQVTKEVRIEAGKTTLDLRFDGGVPVSGVVLGPASEPVSEAQVVLVRDSYGATVPSTRSAGDGSFTLTGVPPGRYQARVSKEGFAVSWSREVTEVGEEAVTGLELRLSAGGALEGQIRGLDREELAQVAVVASNRMAAVQAKLDGEGGYRIAPLAPGRWRVKATVESLGRHLVQDIVLEAGEATTPLDFDFGIGSALTGTVQVAGHPAAGLSVYMQEMEGTFSTEVRTSADGTFEIRDLASGTYRLVVTTERGFRHVETLLIESDRHVDVEIFGARVAGRVVDALTGDPIAEAFVSVRSLDEKALDGGYTRTDSTGGFRIEDVPEGPWKLVVRRDGFVDHERRIEVRGSDEDLEVELTPGD